MEFKIPCFKARVFIKLHPKQKEQVMKTPGISEAFDPPSPLIVDDVCLRALGKSKSDGKTHRSISCV